MFNGKKGVFVSLCVHSCMCERQTKIQSLRSVGKSKCIDFFKVTSLEDHGTKRWLDEAEAHCSPT